MAEIIQVQPTISSIEQATYYDDQGNEIINYAMNIANPKTSQGYFYSTYNPTEHFTYNIVFKEDGITPDNVDNGQIVADDRRKTNVNIATAYAKVIEYHFSFEQVLPKECEDFISFYIPNYNSNYEPADFEHSKNNFANYTQTQFETNIVGTEIKRLPTKSDYIKNVASCRDMGDKDYSEMNILELYNLYSRWQQQGDIYKDATKWNQHLYNCALYCKIYRPEKADDNGQHIQAEDEEGNPIVDGNGNPVYIYVEPYDFRKIMNSVNKVFNFKLPIEEGWYFYNKPTKKWEYIEFKVEVN